MPTFLCWDEKERARVDNLDKLVVKSANESGGYGMLVGPHSTAEQQATFRSSSWRIAELHRAAHASSSPVRHHRGPRRGGHDLRPTSRKIFVIPGGLTRVALRKGSLVATRRRAAAAKTPVMTAMARRGNAAPQQRMPSPCCRSPFNFLIAATSRARGEHARFII